MMDTIICFMVLDIINAGVTVLLTSQRVLLLLLNSELIISRVIIPQKIKTPAVNIDSPSNI